MNNKLSSSLTTVIVLIIFGSIFAGIGIVMFSGPEEQEMLTIALIVLAVIVFYFAYRKAKIKAKEIPTSDIMSIIFKSILAATFILETIHLLISEKIRSLNPITATVVAIVFFILAGVTLYFIRGHIKTAKKLISKKST